MTLDTILWTALFTILPISELRGGLYIALTNGMNPLLAYTFCVVLNCLIAPFLFVFLNTLHKILVKWKFYAKLFDKIVERARHKVKAKVEKYGYWGLALFVAIPLPITGAYTGALGAWILGMDKKKSILVITIGVIIAGIIVTTAILLGTSILKIFYQETQV